MSSRRASERATIWKRLRISRAGVAIGLVAFLVLSGTGAYAYWSSTANMTTTAKAGTLAVTTSWSSSLGMTFTNVTYTKTGEFTVKNTTATTSTAALPYTVTLGYTGATPGPLATNLNLTVWKKDANCNAIGSPSYTGKWGTPPTGVGGTLTAGSSDVWCILTAVSERSDLASTTGTVTLTPTVAAKLTAGTNWFKDSTAASSAIQETKYIYPAFIPNPNLWYRMKSRNDPSLCMDVRGSGLIGSANTDVIAYGCHDTFSANQQVKFAATDTGYVTITFRHDPGANRIGVVGNSSTIGAQLQTQGSVPSNTSQQWQLQNKGAKGYQLVNRVSGLCIEPNMAPVLPVNTFDVKQVVCSDDIKQDFTLTAWQNPVISGNICQSTGSNQTRSFRLNFSPALEDDVTIQLRRVATDSWTTAGTAPYGASSYPVDQAFAVAIGGDVAGTYYYRVVGSLGTQLNSGTYKVDKYTPRWWWDPAAYSYVTCS